MFFIWLLQIITLAVLLVTRYLGMEIGLDSALILSMLLLITTPVVIPLIATIRSDMTPMGSLVTRSGMIGLGSLAIVCVGLGTLGYITGGTLVFVAALLFSIYFALEGRLYFLIALLGLIYTISALVVELPLLAEQASIIVYLALVLGVITEIASPLFARWHTGSRVLLHITPQFRELYRHALAEYAEMIVIGLEVLFFVALLGRGSLWTFDSMMLLYIALGVWGFASLYLFTRSSICTYREIYSSSMARLRQYSRYIQRLYR